METETLELNYGPVLVLKGARKGQRGYYDDDEDGRCVVYFDGKLMSGSYELLNRAWLKNVDETYKVTEYLGKKV